MSQLISIIIPTYNRGDFLLRALNSIFKQTYTHFEIVVIDDGSSDNTSQILSTLVQENKIKYIKQDNRGVSAARNTGFQNSNGELITFLDSDDEWLPHKLQDQINFLAINPHINIVYGEEIWMRQGKRVNQKLIHKKSGGHIFKACVDQCLIGPSSVMLTRGLFNEMQGFDEKFIICEDYDLWLRISSLYEIGFISNPIMIKHGGHSDQLSTKYVAMDKWRLIALNKILEIRELNALDLQYVHESIKKRGTILMQGYKKYNNLKDYDFVKELLAKLI